MTQIDRRTMLAMTATGLTGSRPEGRQPDMDDVSGLLIEIRDELRLARTTCAACPEVEAVRTAQYTYVKTQGRYPATIEVGFRVFETVHDWLRSQPQPVTIAQLPDGRYRLRFGFTALILRTDVAPEFVGYGSDSR